MSLYPVVQSPKEAMAAVWWLEKRLGPATPGRFITPPSPVYVIKEAARYANTDKHYNYVPEPPEGRRDWLQQVNYLINTTVSPGDRKALMTALRKRRSRTRLALVSVELEQATLERLKAWQKAQGLASLDKAVAALLDDIER